MHIDMTHPQARSALIYLDGKRQPYCLDADEEEGWIIVIDVGPDGFAKTAADGKSIAEKRLTGKVEIKFREEEG